MGHRSMIEAEIGDLSDWYRAAGLRRFQDRVVIVTGAGSGMGEATARRFSDEGAAVVLADRDRPNLDRVAADLPSDRTLAQMVDVSRYEQIEAMVRAAIEAFGGLNVLVNNAGIVVGGRITESSLADWESVMAINAGGVFNGCRAAMPYLIESRGCIVNTASTSGLGGDWAMSIYNASKGAVVNLTRALALDHGRDGVRVNSVCPCVTLTPMSAGIEENQEAMAKIRDRIPMGRPALPSDVAAAIAFLASDDARFITGVNLPVDGGVTASNGEPNYAG